jgi:dephospho-CoA kinase
MLRVGLTGGLASGKSTVASLFARRGVHILNADQIGRELMQPGQPVYDAILAHFHGYPDAPPLTLADGQLDRSALARYVLSTGKLDELSRIVHPPVVAEQERRIQLISVADPDAIVMVESALIFEADRAKTAPGFSHRSLAGSIHNTRQQRTFCGRIGGAGRRRPKTDGHADDGPGKSCPVRFRH